MTVPPPGAPVSGEMAYPMVPATQLKQRLIIMSFITAGCSCLGTVSAHVSTMFAVSQLEAEAIPRAYEDGGELSAMIELRRHFPGIVNNENARRCARTIPSWAPMPSLPTDHAEGLATYDPAAVSKWPQRLVGCPQIGDEQARLETKRACQRQDTATRGQHHSR